MLRNVAKQIRVGGNEMESDLLSSILIYQEQLELLSTAAYTISGAPMKLTLRNGAISIQGSTIIRLAFSTTRIL